ncbi:hypothetical protein [Faecalicatena orotica]
MDNTTKTVWQEEPPAAVQHEDAVLKTMMHFLCIVFRIDSASCN